MHSFAYLLVNTQGTFCVMKQIFYQQRHSLNKFIIQNSMLCANEGINLDKLLHMIKIYFSVALLAISQDRTLCCGCQIIDTKWKELLIVKDSTLEDTGLTM